MGKQKRYVSGKDFKDMKQTVDDENDAEAQREKDLDKTNIIMSTNRSKDLATATEAAKQLRKNKHLYSQADYKRKLSIVKQSIKDALSAYDDYPQKKPSDKIKEHLSMKQKMKDYNASDKSMDSPDGSDKRDEAKRKKKWAKQKKKGGSSMNEPRDSKGRWTT